MSERFPLPASPEGWCQVRYGRDVGPDDFHPGRTSARRRGDHPVRRRGMGEVLIELPTGIRV